MTEFDDFFMMEMLEDDDDDAQGCGSCCCSSSLLGMLVVVLVATVLAFLASVFLEWNFWLSFIGYLVFWSLKTILKESLHRRKTH